MPNVSQARKLALATVEVEVENLEEMQQPLSAGGGTSSSG